MKMAIKNMIKKRGVSPVIATILLISLVVIIGLVVFTWMRGFVPEAVVIDGENAELVCEKISFDASYSSNKITLSNFGNYEIHSFDFKFEGEGQHKTLGMSNDYFVGFDGLNQGEVKSSSESVNNYIGDHIEFTVQKITVIPILQGLDKNGEEKEFKCDEQYGKTVQLTN